MILVVVEFVVVVADMEEVGVVDVEEGLLHFADVDLAGDHLLEDAAVGKVALEESADDLAVLVDDLFVDVAFAVGLDFDGLVLGVGVDVAQGHGGDVEEAHGGFTCEEVGHLLGDAAHVGGGDHAFLDGHGPDGRESGDVAGAVDVGVVGPAGGVVDQAEAGQLEAGILEEFDVGANACSDDEEVAGNDGAVAEDDSGDLMFVIDLDFIDADAVVLFNAAGVEGVDVGFGGFGVELFVEEPACEVAEDDFDAQFQEAGGAVDADQAGAQDNDVLFGFCDFLEDFDVVYVAEADHVGGAQHVFDGREEGVGAGGDEELVIALAAAVVQEDFFCGSVEADCLDALFPVDFVEGLKVFFDKAQALQRAFSCQVFVQNAAGVDVLVLGDQDDLGVFVVFTEFSYSVDARCGGSDDYVLFHSLTSSSVMACMGHFSTHMGLAVLPSGLLWTHMLHFMISRKWMLSGFRMPKGQDITHM